MRRFLWAQGSVATPPADGTVLAERYQVLRFPLLQDTDPTSPPDPLSSVPTLAKPYLTLAVFPVAVPRPFTQITLSKTGESLLLLDAIPVRHEALDSIEAPDLLPDLLTTWPHASALQQLTWLWQIAQLWQPAVEAQVADSLLDWQNLRVDEEDVRLLSLEAIASVPTLSDLGNQWRSLVPKAAKPLQPYLSRLVEQLSADKGTIGGLLNSLTRALEFLAENQSAFLQLATSSDQGPTRKRNEDACYPRSGSAGQLTAKAGVLGDNLPPFVIVCDGIGGHQGGSVASQLAIEEVSQHLQKLGSAPNLMHDDMVFLLEKAILAANQEITSRNDAAQRQERARMGTTIVLAFVYGVRLYIAHLGDSRVYRVRSHACRQITLDDDIASREMRLGSQLYHDALRASSSGALVQALGMAASRNLHPTVNLYPVTQESVFLLCSDGLSDNDLIERLWSTELRPVATGDRDVKTAAQRLIDVANTQNGHDNVTVGLLKVTPKSSGKLPTVPADYADVLAAEAPAWQAAATQNVISPDSASLDAATTIADAGLTRPKRWRPWPLLITSIVMAAIAGIVGAVVWQRLMPGSQLSEAQPSAGATLSPSATPIDPSAASREGDRLTVDDLGTDGLGVGDYLQIQAAVTDETATAMTVTATPPNAELSPAIDLPQRMLLLGTVVQVINRQKTPDNEVWVRLQVCSVPAEAAETEVSSGSSAGSAAQVATSERSQNYPLPLAQPGDQGWLLELSVPNLASRLLDTSPSQQGLCTN